MPHLPHPDGPPALLVATGSPAAEELVVLQGAAGGAPAWQAILDRSTVHVADITEDDRWSTFGNELVAVLSLGTVLAFCLLIDGESLASLALYTGRAHGFDRDDVELAAAFAEHAAIAFNQAAQAEQIGNVRVALEHARVIGAALGIMMVGFQDHPGAGFRPAPGGWSARKSEAVRIGRGNCADG